MKNFENEAKPFIKWAGGKSSLVGDIKKYYPDELGNEIYKYCEPFVGGGAVLFDILSNYDIKEVYISDINEELINLYKTIKNNVEDLILILKKIQDVYILSSEEERKKYYYEKRDEFNKYILKEIDDIIYGSALFIFLNRTCFNGLYRVNKSGLFNVPMGRYKNPRICDDKNLRVVSNKLQKVQIFNKKYDESIDFVDKNTFVYFDPPYRPISESSSFVSYAKDMFDDNEQINLANYFKKLSDKGAICVLSNSDPKNTSEDDNFFDELYKEFNIHRVKTNRRINSNGNKRGELSELLITNRF
ncbi:DNA adenine methylase [Oceanivirga miroungae]|uniref:Site-specific DNA-methyltransferase (adenine-specific) n=1 Tax=Oceanivirga miroungae TaxID=1130046 RepID=A0A6I8M8M6_9FUSO|nr:DNA adenine methylase [Oceanivirga miroungae]VWL85876.1 DNA adenine methylase [Oceanivirga miroungae]